MSDTRDYRGGPALYEEAAIRKAVSHGAAILSAERAFTALAEDQVVSPMPLGAEFPEVHGEVHVKGAYIRGAPVFAFKVATGFYGNVEMGVPTGSGLVLVFDAETGFPLGVLGDNGYLTDLRTAAAGALAAKHLTPRRPLVVAVVGAGVQARFQAELIHRVRDFKELRVWSRQESSRRRYVKDMSALLKVPVYEFPNVAMALDGADLVVTATPAQEPLVFPAMVKKGATIIAVGSDGPNKQELAVDLLLAAEKLVPDVTAQCIRLGEIHHAVKAGLLPVDGAYTELGHIVTERASGRVGDETIVCDLTGSGAQDTAIAEVAWTALTKRGL